MLTNILLSVFILLVFPTHIYGMEWIVFINNIRIKYMRYKLKKIDSQLFRVLEEYIFADSYPLFLAMVGKLTRKQFEWARNRYISYSWTAMEQNDWESIVWIKTK